MCLNDCVGLVITSVFNTTYKDLGTRSVFGLLKLTAYQTRIWSSTEQWYSKNWQELEIQNGQNWMKCQVMPFQIIMRVSIYRKSFLSFHV